VERIADNRWLKEVMDKWHQEGGKEADRELNERNPGGSGRERRGRMLGGYRMLVVENRKTSVKLRNRDT
jgi:hypothetical protein